MRFIRLLSIIADDYDVTNSKVAASTTEFPGNSKPNNFLISHPIFIIFSPSCSV